MFKINIVAVGKVKENYFLDGINEYAKRISKYAQLNIYEVKEENFSQIDSPSMREKIMDLEGEQIIKKLKGKVVSLCIEGEKMSSEKFVKFIKKSLDLGEEITFVIGGSYGISNKVKALSKDKLSFSDMTFPHTMARLILIEQIYRAFTILNSTTYHK